MGRAALRVAWWATTRVVGPTLLIAAVLAYRWHTGAPMRPDWSGQRVVTRQVRASLQIAVSAAVALAAWRPVGPVVSLTAAAALLAGVALALLAAATYTRPPTPAPVSTQPPRRVHSTVHHLASGGR